MISRISRAIASAALILMGMTAAGEAQYYEGKRITVLVNYGAGGTTDITARMIARHLGKYIPGNPELIVRNMPGAGGITGTNHMGQAADADGLTVAVFAAPIMQQVLSDPALSVDLSEFVWLGGVGLPTVCFIRKDAGDGISSVDDLLTMGSFKVAGYRNTSSTDIRMRMGLDLFGIEYGYVPGYRSSSKVNAAILQNEAQFSCASILGIRSTFGPSLIEPGLGIALWYFSAVDSDGNQVRDPRLEDIPTFVDVFERLNGERPSGMLFDSLTLINNLMVNMLWGSFVPKGTPDEAVDALRNAWDALSGDEEFIAEYKALTSGRPIFLSAAGTEEHLESLASLHPEMIEFVKGYASQE